MRLIGITKSVEFVILPASVASLAVYALPSHDLKVVITVNIPPPLHPSPAGASVSFFFIEIRKHA